MKRPTGTTPALKPNFIQPSQVRPLSPFLRKQEPKGGVWPGFPRSRGKCPKDKEGHPLSRSEGGAGAKRQRGMPAEAGNPNQPPTQTRKPPPHQPRTNPLSPSGERAGGEGAQAKARSPPPPSLPSSKILPILVQNPPVHYENRTCPHRTRNPNTPIALRPISNPDTR